MSMQGIFNNEAIEMLPKIKKFIQDHSNDSGIKNSMISITLNRCCNSRIAICNMNESQLDKFQEDLSNELIFKLELK